MLTEIQLWVLSATAIVALNVVCVMLLRAVIPGQIKRAPDLCRWGALNRLAGVCGAEPVVRKLSPCKGRAVNPRASRASLPLASPRLRVLRWLEAPRDETVTHGSLGPDPAADPAQLDLAEQPDEDESRDGEEDHKP
jgi:hypothetical protein